MIFHFIVTELLKYENQYNKVHILSKTSEESISITNGNYNRKIVFLDSYRFLHEGLSDIAKSLDSKDIKILEKYFSIEIFKEKGIYSYEYIMMMWCLCHTLPIFTRLGRCPIVSWDFSGAVSIFWTLMPFLSSTNDFYQD